MVRFTKRLDYQGFADFKRALLSEILADRGSNESVRAPYEELSQVDEITDIAPRLFSLMRIALDDTEQNLNADDLVEATTLIADAESVVFFSHGGSGHIANTAAEKFLILGFNSLSHTDDYLLELHAKYLDDTAVVIALSHTGVTKAVENAVRLAAARSIPIIAITGAQDSPIAELSDVHLRTAVPHTAVGSDAGVTRVAQVALLDCLAAAAAHHRLRNEGPTSR